MELCAEAANHKVKIFPTEALAWAWIRTYQEPLKPAGSPKCYAVATGLTSSTVYPNPNVAVQAQQDSPDAQLQVFDNYDQAWEWIFSVGAQLSSGFPKVPVPLGSPTGVADVLPEEPVTSPIQLQEPWVDHHPQGRSSGPAVPLLAIGKDPSTKTKNEAFGINLNKGAAYILKGVDPPGLSPSDAEDVAAVFRDGVGCPGKETTDDSDAVAHLSMAFEEISQRLHQDQSGQSQKKNLRWRSSKILTLRDPNNYEELKELGSEILEAKGDAITKVIDSLEAIFEKYPWAPEIIHSWSQYGFVTRMARDTVEWYHHLIQHLLSLSFTVGWDVAKEKLKFHVKNLDRIRTDANTRLECLCKNYAYLRDGHSEDWRSAKLDHKRLLAMTQKVADLQVLPTGEGWTCSKCKTSIIHNKSTTYPLQHLPNKDVAKMVGLMFAGKSVLPQQE
jgi:hypothetical protein